MTMVFIMLGVMLALLGWMFTGATGYLVRDFLDYTSGRATKWGGFFAICAACTCFYIAGRMTGGGL